MRHRAKADTNQPAIVAALRSAGASVQHLHTIGKGCPDIVVGWKRQNYLFELKVEGPPSLQKLTFDEHMWHSTWRGQVDVVTTAHEALAKLGIVRAK